MSYIRFLFLFGSKLVCLITFCGLAAACQSSIANISKGVAHPEDGFYQLFPNRPLTLGVAIQPIRTASRQTAFPDASKGSYSGTSRRYVNTELNSRSNIDLAGDMWRVEWKAEIPSSFEPISVLEFKDKIVVEADRLWFLFDGAGKKFIQGQLGASSIFLDDSNFYTADSTGMIVGQKLSDGKPSFGLSLFFGDEYARSFVLRNGRRMIVVSRERELDPHKAENREQSLVELVDLGDPLKTDQDGLLTSSKAIKHLARKTNILLAVASGNKLVLATKDRIYTTDPDLNITQALSGEFIPIAMSLDEVSRIYIVVEKRGRRFLWTVLPSGELNSEFELPPAFGNDVAPSAIGFDHTAYLSAGNEILAIDQSGKPVWQAKLESKVQGIVITPNKKLLIAAGHELLAFDVQGKKQVIFDFGDQNVVTAPALTADGSILIASQNYLLKLTSRPR